LVVVSERGGERRSLSTLAIARRVSKHLFLALLTWTPAHPPRRPQAPRQTSLRARRCVGGARARSRARMWCAGSSPELPALTSPSFLPAALHRQPEREDQEGAAEEGALCCLHPVRHDTRHRRLQDAQAPRTGARFVGAPDSHLVVSLARLSSSPTPPLLPPRAQAWVVFADVAAATKAMRELQGFFFYDKPMVSCRNRARARNLLGSSVVAAPGPRRRAPLARCGQHGG
jgi:hypothetical protein